MAALPTVMVIGESLRTQHLEWTLRDMGLPKPERAGADARADVAVLCPTQTGDIPAAVRRALTDRARRVIVVAEAIDAAMLVASVAAGADGWVPPTISPTALARTIRGIHEGESGFSRIDTVVLVAALRTGRVQVAVPDGLTRREREVHRALQTGQPTREIAGELGVSEATIRWHTARIAKKLQATTGPEAESAAIAIATDPARSKVRDLPQMDDRRAARVAAGTRPGAAVAPAVRLADLGRAELRVVELVADGLSNREIAERLFLSRHTIESHLKRVYAKLHIRSRVDLTRLLLSAGDPRLAS